MMTTALTSNEMLHTFSSFCDITKQPNKRCHPLMYNSTANMLLHYQISEPLLCNKYTHNNGRTVATNKHSIIEDVLGTVFYVQSYQRLYNKNHWGKIVKSSSELFKSYKLRRFTVCCSQKSSVWITESAKLLLVTINSKYQYKPHV
jgi:hypothetical protein